MRFIFLLIIYFTYCFSEEDILETKSLDMNAKIKILKEELHTKYQMAKDLYDKKKLQDAVSMLKEIKQIKDQLVEEEKKYKEECSCTEDQYAFWDQGDTTISQLVMEFGSLDYLYIIPPEIAQIKISLFSSIPIPRNNWDEMLEIVLANKGIGVRKISASIRELYVLKKELLRIDAIATSRRDLDFIKENTIVFFVLETRAEDIRSLQDFFERFSDQRQIDVQSFSNKIILIAPKHHIEKLLDLKNVIFKNGQQKKIKIINLYKIKASEAEKIIEAFFYDRSGKRRPSFFKFPQEEISLFSLFDDRSLALVGNHHTIKRAEKIITDLENQLEEKREKTIFWYTCKHSDPQDIVDVLTRVYSSLKEIPVQEEVQKIPPKECPTREFIPTRAPPSTAYNPTLPVKPGFVQPGVIDQDKKKAVADNFIVDPKTGSILMVVEKIVLEKIKDLLKKMDVPKRMVQIDVLLMERQLQERKQSGINILKIGQRGNPKDTKLSFDAMGSSRLTGILDFILKRPKAGTFPSIDLMMSFLMGKKDIKVNANPSILAVNQTPATISIVEEISINNGAVQIDTVSGITVEKSYTRAQFGITIVMTPNIHFSEEDKNGYVSLDTNITFDTTGSSSEDRPPVARRHLESQVRIADGETVILGGLRKKSKEDIENKIPFLGNIPGIGKIFGTTKLMDNSTEMFIFITPKIIKDPIEDLKEERRKFLNKRPGDIPEFLQKLKEGKGNKKRQLIENNMRQFF